MNNSLKPCTYCHPDEEGKYQIMDYLCPTDPRRSATISVYDGILAVEMRHPDDERDQRLSCPIKYCPFCGREL